MNEQNVVHTHNVKLLSLKREETDTCYSMNFDNFKLIMKYIMSHLQKDKYCMIPLNEVSKVVKLTETESRNDGCQRLGGEKSGELLFNGCRVSVLQDEKVLEICCTTM